MDRAMQFGKGTEDFDAAANKQRHKQNIVEVLNARRHNPAPAWVRQRQTEDA